MQLNKKKSRRRVKQKKYSVIAAVVVQNSITRRVVFCVLPRIESLRIVDEHQV